MKAWKKALSLAIALIMVVSLLPISAMAIADALPEAVNGEIKLTEDVTLANEWLVTTDTVLDLNGFTISNKSVTTTDYLGTITLKSGNLTINDSSAAKTGRVEGARFAVVVQGGTLTVNGGTFGKESSAASNKWNEPLFVGGGSGIINGGTFVDGSVEYFKVYDEPGSLVIQGGKFDSLPYYPAGNQGAAILAPEPDHTYMAAYATYGDFAAANSDSFTYDSTSNTLTLTNDYNGYLSETGDWSGFFMNKDVTIDLNGHVWDMKTSDSFYPFPFSEMVINGGTEITMKDSSGTDAGTLKNRTGNVLEVMGALNLEGGTLEQVGWTVAGPTIQLDGNSTVNMTGGTVKGTQSAFSYKRLESGTPGPIRLSISNGRIETRLITTYDRADASCEITGGTFQYPVEEAFCANGYIPANNADGTFTVKRSDAMVASVTDSQGNVTEYVSLGKALASASAGDTVTLLDDVELQPETELGISGTVVLDLAGHAIRNTDPASEDGAPILRVATDGGLTIRDSREGGILHNVRLIGQWNSSIRFEGGTIDNSELPDNSVGILVSKFSGYPVQLNQASVTITGGTIKASGSGVRMFEGTLEITGGTVIGGSTGVTIGSGASAGVNSSAAATISGGSITGGVNGIDILGSQSKLTVTNGVITGTEGNAINAGKSGTKPTVAMQGGTLTGGKYGIYASCGNGASFTVSNGFVGGTTSALSVSTAVPMSISGGYFTSDPSTYLVSGKAALTSDVPGYVFMVGDKEETIAEPATAAPDVTMGEGIAPDDEEAVKNAAAGVEDNGALDAAANSMTGKVTQEQKDAAANALKELLPDAADENIKIYIQTYLAICPTKYETTTEKHIFALDITPKYRVVASTAGTAEDIQLEGNDANAVVLPGSEKDITGLTTMTLTVPLPTGFVSSAAQTVFVQHKGYEYTASITEVSEDFYATFTNPHGFSEFTLSTESEAVAIVDNTRYTSFQDAVDAVEEDGTIVKLLKGGLSATISRNVSFTVESNGNDYTLSAGSGYQMSKDGDTYTFTQKNSGGNTPFPPIVFPPVVSPIIPTMPGLPFTDVAGDAWYYDAVEYVYDIGLMDGVGNGKFNPTGETTRGMIVMILYRMEGAPRVYSDGAYWWSDARVWAMEEGISDGTNMTGKITREQFAAMLYRYAKTIGADTSARGSLSRFSDAQGVSGWAKEAMQWAVGEGIIGGANGKLNPKGLATRAEVAAMFMRFDKSFAK